MLLKSAAYKQLGKIIKLKRVENELSQEDLAIATKVSIRAISTIENGRKISDSNLDKLSNYFAVDFVMNLNLLNKKRIF